MGALIAQLRALGPVRLGALGGVAVVLLGLFAWLALRAGDVPMGVLYSELEQRDAAQIVAALDRQRVPYRLANGGTQIQVPDDQVPKLRLLLARDGLPSGGGVGYEVFDRNDGLTSTPFQQEMNRLRAMEGELARTIRSLDGVRGARVHLVLPRREAFSRERGEAQASVVLTMQGAQRLDREGVQAVLHLVATAVPGLKPRNVSLVDSRGELLARGGEALTGPAGAQTQDELRRAQELRLSRNVEEMLERVLGSGRVRAEATVEMDFDRVETREERFDPDNQVPRSQQSTTENNRNSEPGNVSVSNNLPNADSNNGGGGSQEARQEETTNYEIGKTTRNTLREHPVVKRLSVAVLVDGVVEPVEGGAPHWRERTPEELARLTALVRSAVGFDERRGDQVQVVSMRFAEPEGETGEAPRGWLGLPLSSPMLVHLAENGLFALVALAAILLVGRPVAGKLAASLVPPAAAALPGAAADATALPGADAPPALTADGTPALPNAAGETRALPAGAEGEAVVSLAMVEGQMRVSTLKRIAELVDAHPDEALIVLRRWLAPEEVA